MGNRKESPITHCIGMRKEGWKGLDSSLEAFGPQNCPSTLPVLNLPSPFQAGSSRERLCRLCLVHTSNSLRILSTRGLHFLDATTCKHIGRPVIASTIAILTNAFCFARPSPPLRLPTTARTRPICLPLLIAGPAGTRICSHFGLAQCQLRHITPTADLWT